MKKIFASDGALKLLSVIIAIAIWIYIALVMDPAIEVTVRDLPIQFVGQEIIAAKKLALISESSTTVTIKIKGSRKKMGNNDMDTIIARADLSNVTEAGESDIPIDVVIPFENQGISSQSQYTVHVKIENKVEKEIPIEIKTTGSLAVDYMPGDIEAKPSNVVISGPKSAVENVLRADVTLNYNSEDVDIDTNLPIVFYGADNKEISMLDAIMRRISVSCETAEVHCPVLKMHKVRIKADFGWQHLPENLKYTTEPYEVYVFGDESALAKLDEIETEQIPIDKLLGSGKVKIKLHIPDGIKIFNDITEVEISADIENNG